MAANNAGPRHSHTAGKDADHGASHAGSTGSASASGANQDQNRLEAAERDAIVALALAEDLGSAAGSVQPEHDVTAALIPGEQEASAVIIARESAVLCGTAWAAQVLQQIDSKAKLVWLAAEGDWLEPNREFARVTGKARSLLSAERSMLNFLQTLSATATETRRLAALIAHTNCRLLDTRKTLPGLRRAQKHAVRVGGGQNHRMGLFDAFLIKENHIRACDGIAAAVQAARTSEPGKPIEVEVRNLDELASAINAGADTAMLDNFTLDGLREAVALNSGKVQLEASGGVSEEELVSVAETGVNFVSVGALTKHVRAIDLSMLVE